MKPITLLFTLLGFNSFAQLSGLRDFRAVLGSNLRYTMSDIVQTTDGSYSFNASSGMFSADGGWDYSNVILKTDANFEPQWSYQIYGRNGKTAFPLTNGDLITYSIYGAVVDVYRFRPGGQLNASNRYHLPWSTTRSLDVHDAVMIGDVIHFAGSSYHYNNYEYQGAILRIDTLGTIIGTDSLSVPGYTYNEIKRIAKGNGSDFFVAGEASTTGDYISFVSHIDASNNVLWTAKIDWPTIFSYQQHSLAVQSNGDVYLGSMYVNSAAGTSTSETMHITRLSSSGTQIWTKTTDELSSLSHIKPLSNGHILLSGTFRDPGTYNDRVALVEMDEDGNVIWAKKYYPNYGGVGVPYFSDADSMHVIFRHSGHFLKMLTVDATGNNNCLAIDHQPVFHDVAITVLPMQTQLLAGTNAELDSFHPQPYAQTNQWNDTCLAYPSSSVTVDVCAGTDYTFADSTVATNVQANLSHTSVLSGQAVGGGDSLVVETLQVTNVDLSVTINPTSLQANETNATYQWIDCSTGQPITSATNQSFFPGGDGYFAVIVTKNGCSDTTICTNFFYASLDDQSGVGFSLYPNPTTGNLLTISFSGSSAMTFSLIDLAGKKVLEQHSEASEKHQFDVQDIATGLYEYAIQLENVKLIHGKIAVTR